MLRLLSPNSGACRNEKPVVIDNHWLWCKQRYKSKHKHIKSQFLCSCPNPLIIFIGGWNPTLLNYFHLQKVCDFQEITLQCATVVKCGLGDCYKTTHHSLRISTVPVVWLLTWLVFFYLKNLKCVAQCYSGNLGNNLCICCTVQCKLKQNQHIRGI